MNDDGTARSLLSTADTSTVFWAAGGDGSTVDGDCIARMRLTATDAGGVRGASSVYRAAVDGNRTAIAVTAAAYASRIITMTNGCDHTTVDEELAGRLFLASANASAFIGGSVTSNAPVPADWP